MNTSRTLLSLIAVAGLALTTYACSPPPSDDSPTSDTSSTSDTGNNGGNGGSVDLPMEAGAFSTTDTADDATWTTVDFEQQYDEPPVVFATPSSEGGMGDPAAFQIRNVTTESFEIVAREPASQNGTHDSVESHYLAVEPGESEMPDGSRIAAGRLETNRVADSWNDIDLPDGFDSPIAMAQLQTANNETNSTPDQPSLPWLTVAVANVSSDLFNAAFERSECSEGELTSREDLGWVAFESGTQGTISGADGTSVAYETIRTPEDVTGWDDGGTTVEFERSYDSAPGIVAHKQTWNAEDGGWLRLADASSSGVTALVDETQCSDDERSNTTGESAGLFVFSGSFRVQP